jgi:hypothetical protein
MAVVIYSNGVLEDYNSRNLTFSEEELLSLFTEFADIKTVRIPELLNTWCIFGKNDNDKDPLDYNRIASLITNTDIYSHALFVHDSEINPEWNASDRVIYKSYNEFLESLKKSIDIAAADIVNEFTGNDEYEEKLNKLPQLEALGTTHDKRIMYLYDPDDQISAFYNNEEFSKFSQKTYEYISQNPQISDPFTLYADKRAVIIVEQSKVEPFLKSILENFKTREEYEICTDITKIMDEWEAINRNTSENKNNIST